MLSNFPLDYPYSLSFPDLWIRYLLAALVYVLLGLSLWIILHRFIFGRGGKALTAGLAVGVLMIFWPLAILPYLRFFRLEIYLVLVIPAVLLLILVNRYLWKRIKTISESEKLMAKKVIPLIGLVAFLGVSIFSWTEYQFDRNSYQEKIAKLDQFQEQLVSIQDKAAQITQDLAADTIFVSNFKKRNLIQITSQAQTVISETESVNAIAITDRDGITIAAPHNPLLIGRDLTALGPAHVKVLGGEATKTLELGITSPLVVGAGTPIKEGGAVIGAVFAAQLINRSFLEELAYQIDAQNLGIYCNCDKLYVSTLEDSQLNKAVQNYAQLAFTDKNLLESKTFIQNLGLNQESQTLVGRLITSEQGEPLALLLAFSPYPSEELSWSLKATTVFTTTITILLFFTPLVFHRFAK